MLDAPSLGEPHHRLVEWLRRRPDLARNGVVHTEVMRALDWPEATTQRILGDLKAAGAVHYHLVPVPGSVAMASIRLSTKARRALVSPRPLADLPRHRGFVPAGTAF